MDDMDGMESFQDEWVDFESIVLKNVYNIHEVFVHDVLDKPTKTGFLIGIYSEEIKKVFNELFRGHIWDEDAND